MKPHALAQWEERCERLRGEIPRLCVTCVHHAARSVGDELYCQKFEASPPLDFVSTEGQCAEWSSVLDGIPF